MRKVDPQAQRAARATRARLGQLALAKRMPEKISSLLLQLSDHFLDTKETITSIRHRAEATEWDLKLFQRELGISPRDLRSECRLETFLQLLRDTSATVERAAKQVGYTRRSLERLIRKSWDLSPKELRDHLRGIHVDQRARSDELLSWLFWVRLHRGEVDVEFARDALNHQRDRFSPSR